ncbi:MAG TPA: AbrB/MazE/SpoVT family DNA-binding domain-containing protein [Dongiaceae bacterium]|nr:AbrB/MazE/SpoVT family DNA-binding domain-containing protein [Dongiaceae bacterium]
MIEAALELGLRLPRALADELGLAPGQHVEMRTEGKRLVIKPTRPRYTLDELLAACGPSAPLPPHDWTRSRRAGREQI